MELRSSSLADGAPIDRRHAWPDCGGANVSPDLAWTGVPPGTASFAVACYDPDAPRGWWHWTVYDIPAAAAGIPEGGPLPDGAVETRNSFRAAGWGGPCPPAGKPHRYVFTVYALPAAHLPVPAGTDPGEVSRVATARALGAASLTATFRRS
ncbi:YbhB/YbcL family Raf kinase inhibitor-like protein [Georgenia ruanii]|nr:YbhB/YbcL family Raf kinase inhibitor-like protein [Georgenia ruanii]MPV88922.1 YbhB/YbcL family Raf kinase inhibitor-like protein [Georgenia ruanii]